MFGLGMSEIIFLGVLALIVIGPKELPELARTLGRFMNELKRSTNVLGEELKQQTRIDLNATSQEQHASNSKNESANTAPQQLELSEQQSLDIKNEEHKPS